MTPYSIAAVVITFNEERNIARCIDSLQKVTDEIIVLDSNSTDNTEKICLAKGVKFVRKPWQGYSASKNYANSLAACDYILSIDADEALDENLQKSIVKIKPVLANYDAYEINRLTCYCGRWIKHSGWYPEWKLRLFRKESAYWDGSIHENLVFHKKHSAKKLRGNLLHYSFPSLYVHIKKIVTYTELIAARDVARGKKYYFISHGLIKPALIFLRKYFLQMGFLDGYQGFLLARMSAFERYFRYYKYTQLIKQRGT